MSFPCDISQHNTEQGTVELMIIYMSTQGTEQNTVIILQQLIIFFFLKNNYEKFLKSIIDG